MAKDSSRAPENEKSDLSLTGIIKALDLEDSSVADSSAGESSAFDPNATMNYQQAGMPYPELPFADSSPDVRDSQSLKRITDTGDFQAQLESRISLADSQDLRKVSEEATGAKPRAGAAATGAKTRAQKEGTQAKTRSQKTSTSAKTSAQKASTPAKAGTQKASTAAKTSAHKTSSPTKTAAQKNRASAAPRKTPAHSEAKAPEVIRSVPATTSFQPINVKQSTYKIRGGGRKWGVFAKSPIAIIAAVLFLAVGIGVVYSAANSFMNTFSIGGGGVQFELTPEETRQAIDSRLPILIHYVDFTIEDTLWTLTEAGHNVFANDRYQPDSLDTGAVTSELISMPKVMTEEQMTGYYEGGFNAYSPEELTEYFNGAFILDLARGELGSWNKLRYVNLNATGILAEMEHLANLQQLSGETVTISAQGIDSRGNHVIQGAKVIDGERILYFKIAACLFKDVYYVKSLSNDSVYITCTVATYDFFSGVDTITPL
ncbi:MAG: hypothetical protein FWE41_03180 [Coriobacteriia bacterium]|nr:hypothetical protein [Coriobacteriia bacterium]MCL2750679.1 hypothetical protein [Coriobacteriia bacterium]